METMPQGLHAAHAERSGDLLTFIDAEDPGRTISTMEAASFRPSSAAHEGGDQRLGVEASELGPNGIPDDSVVYRAMMFAQRKTARTPVFLGRPR